MRDNEDAGAGFTTETINFSEEDHLGAEFSLDVGAGEEKMGEKDGEGADRVIVCWWVQDGPADCWRLWHSAYTPRPL